MKRRAVILASVLLLSVFAIICVIWMKRELRRHHAEATANGPQGLVTYRCIKSSQSVDYDPRAAGPTGLTLIARFGAGRTVQWQVQEPGAKPSPTSSFEVNSGSIGGSQGILWHGGIPPLFYRSVISSANMDLKQSGSM